MSPDTTQPPPSQGEQQQQPVASKRWIIVLNPGAGGGGVDHENELRELVAQHPHLEALWLIEQEPEQIVAQLKKMLAEEPALAGVAAAGGDGTVMQVIDVLMGRDDAQRPALGILPVGTGNLLAKSLLIPLTMPEAVALLDSGSPYGMDVACANHHHFALVAGAGVDAAIMRETTREKKRRWGPLAYFITGMQYIFGPGKHKTRFHITLDGDRSIRTKGAGVLVINRNGFMNSLINVGPMGPLNPGLLDICVLRAGNWLQAIPMLVRLFTADYRDPAMDHYQAKEVRVVARPQVSVQTDGDVTTTTPLQIYMLPNALKVMVPQAVLDQAKDPEEDKSFSFGRLLGQALGVETHLVQAHDDMEEAQAKSTSK